MSQQNTTQQNDQNSNTSNTQQIEIELIKHLNVMYCNNGQYQQEQFQAANKFLTSFRVHPSAWNVCLNILSSSNGIIPSSNPQIISFSSQTIYDNLLEQIININIQQKMQIVNVLQTFIKLFTEKYLLSYFNSNNSNDQNIKLFRFILTKCCQSIAYLALNTNEANNMISSVFNTCLNIQMVSSQISLLWINLEILNGFALEFKLQHVNQNIIIKTQNYLNNIKYNTLFCKIIKLSINASMRNNNNILYRLLQITFQTLNQWVNIVDIYLSSLESIGLLDDILKCMRILYSTTATDYSQTRQFMVESMIKMISKGNSNSNILNKITTSLSSLSPIVNKSIELKQKDITRSLCNLICFFCESEVSFIAAGNNNALQLVAIILKLTSCSSSIIVEETFNFWSSLQDISMNNRHPSLQKDVYKQLLLSLLLHTTDPKEFDKHSRFKKNASEIFISSYFVLEQQFFNEIQKQLQIQFNLINNNNNNNNNNDNDLILVRIESCIFALTEIAQEVRDELKKKNKRDVVKQMLNNYIVPICEILLKCGIYKSSINTNAILLHLLTSIFGLFAGYAFHICETNDLLQKCLLFCIEIPCKYRAIIAYKASKTFKQLLYHSSHIWIKQLNDFENILKFVIENIGNGSQFYNKLTGSDLLLLEEYFITNIDEINDDISANDIIIYQQKSVAIYYESLCQIIDIYNDKNRQKSLINNLITKYIKDCNKILTNLLNNSITLNVSIFYQINTDLYIFSGFMRGLSTTEYNNTKNHPLIPHIQNILNICGNIIKQLPAQWNNNNNDQKQQSQQLPSSLSEININLLYAGICDVLEKIMDTFGTDTQNILNGLVQITLHLLKNTKSSSSAKLLKKMVKTFASNTNIASNFLSLIKDAVIYFNNLNDNDLRIYHQTINEIFESVDNILEMYRNNNNNNNNNIVLIWTEIVPHSIQLSLKILIKVQDREALRNTLKLLINIFDSSKYRNQLNQISNQLKKSLLPNVISILFNGIAIHFERMVAKKAIEVYYNLILWDNQYIKQQTMIELTKLNINVFKSNENNKTLFMSAFWKQRENKRKFDAVMTCFFSVCRNYGQPDAFGGWL